MYYSITKEQAKELRKSMEKIEKSSAYKKVLAVALRGEGKKDGEIADITGFHSDMIGRFAKRYKEGGLEGLIFDGRKGGNSRNMSDEEEKEFLSQFEEMAKNGKITTVADIAKAYDEKVDKKHESNSTVYYLLQKHGWRQIMPQTAHPGKASEAEIEASKKLTLNSKK